MRILAPYATVETPAMVVAELRAAPAAAGRTDVNVDTGIDVVFVGMRGTHARLGMDGVATDAASPESHAVRVNTLTSHVWSAG